MDNITNTTSATYSQNIPLVDNTVLTEIISLMAARAPEILTMFARDAQSQVSGITTALQQNDLETAGRLSHTLKSSARQIGASMLGELASAIETLTRDPHHSPQSLQYQAQLQTLQQHLQQCLVPTIIALQAQAQSILLGKASNLPVNAQVK